MFSTFGHILKRTSQTVGQLGSICLRLSLPQLKRRYAASFSVTREFQFAQSPIAIPLFQLLSDPGDSHLLPSKLGRGEDVGLYDATWCLRMIKEMVLLSTIDRILYDAQRQGRISFYMTTLGEEAAVLGSAAALGEDNGDIVFAQYREAGVLLHRGFSLDSMMNQCFSNSEDVGKGRQMPVHYGSRDLNYHTISSPLCTQLPQAVGAAYALKMKKKLNAEKTSTSAADERIVICYFGEGAASEGDFHAAMLMAATSQVPLVFFCRNNGYAISTPASEQYRGDGIAARGIAYGIDTVRVDGNDVFAVHYATRAARRHAASTNKPVLIEAMTYRVGHHSTSDDSTLYRPKTEVDEWILKNNPLTRLREYMVARTWWPEGAEGHAQETKVNNDARKRVLEALSRAELLKKPTIDSMFDDVYYERTPGLARQARELKEVTARYPDFFPIDAHAQE